MKIGHSNVNSLVRKLLHANYFLKQQMLHILGITETHLLQSMPNSVINTVNWGVLIRFLHIFQFSSKTIANVAVLQTKVVERSLAKRLMVKNWTIFFVFFLT